MLKMLFLGNAARSEAAQVDKGFSQALKVANDTSSEIAELRKSLRMAQHEVRAAAEKDSERVCRCAPDKCVCSTEFAKTALKEDENGINDEASKA